MADISSFLDIIRNGSDGDSVRDAIINCMNQINKDSKWIVKSKVIKGKVSELNSGSPYVAAAGTVWKDVTLEIQDDIGQDIPSTTVTAHDFTVDNSTENGEYTAKELFGDNTQFGTISVNLDFSSSWEDIADNVSITAMDLDTATNTFHAETKGFAAVRSITFTDVKAAEARGGYVGTGGQTYYPITFMDNTGETIGKKDIPEGTAITYDIPAEIKSKHPGENFMGWSGGGVAESAGTVYAKWGNPSILVGEISDDWSTIVADGGSHYAYGQYKSISVNVEIPYSADLALFPDATEVYPQFPTEGKYRYAISAYMIKVANGEGGSTSSWMSGITAASYTAPSSNTTAVRMIPSHITTYLQRKTYPDNNIPRYDEDLGMKWINNIFMQYVLSSTIKSHIMNVEKPYKYIVEGTWAVENRSFSYPIWLPSVKELYVSDDLNSDIATDGLFTDATQGSLNEEAYITNHNSVAYLVDNLQMSSVVQRKSLLCKLNSADATLSGYTRDSVRSDHFQGARLQGPCMTQVTDEDVDPSGPFLFMRQARYPQHSVCEANIFGFCLTT